MTGFNYKESQNAENCWNCYQGIIYPLSRGLLCGYTDKETRGDHRCGLYIRQQVKDKTEPEAQEELFG